MAECKNCGAQISENDAECPYCHAMQYDAAEAQYMDKLYSMEDSMGELDDDARGVVLKDIARNILIILAASVVAVLIGILAGYVKYLEYNASYTDKKKVIEAMDWYDANIEELETYYNRRDFAAMQSLISGTKGRDALKNWIHYPLYTVYSYGFSDFENAGSSSASDSKLRDYEFTRKYRGAVDVIAIKCVKNIYSAKQYNECTDEDKAIVDEWISEAEKFMTDEIGLTREQYVADIKDIYSDGGYSDYTKARMYAEKYYEMYAGGMQ